jgi:hypothetical protein
MYDVVSSQAPGKGIGRSIESPLCVSRSSSTAAKAGAWARANGRSAFALVYRSLLQQGKKAGAKGRDVRMGTGGIVNRRVGPAEIGVAGVPAC